MTGTIFSVCGTEITTTKIVIILNKYKQGNQLYLTFWTKELPRMRRIAACGSCVNKFTVFGIFINHVSHIIVYPFALYRFSTVGNDYFVGLSLSWREFSFRELKAKQNGLQFVSALSFKHPSCIFVSDPRFQLVSRWTQALSHLLVPWSHVPGTKVAYFCTW